MVIIGLDMGEKRIGIAKSDELGMFSHAICFIERTSDEELASKLNEIIHSYAAKKVICGFPKKLDGTCGEAGNQIMQLVERLTPQLTVPIELWDERLTTKEAYRYMQGSSLSGKKKKKKIDALAAQIMLQNYLDCNKS